jgi:hypothetical protein
MLRNVLCLYTFRRPVHCELQLLVRLATVPRPGLNLLGAVKLKVLASRLGAESIQSSGDSVVLRLAPGLAFSPEQRQLPMPRQIQIGSTQLRFTPSGRLPESEWEGVLVKALESLAAT